MPPHTKQPQRHDRTSDSGTTQLSSASLPPRKISRDARTSARRTPYTQPSLARASSSSPSPISTESSGSFEHIDSRWPCRLSGCTKSFTRPYDLIRHLVVAHHSRVVSASAEEIIAAGVPHDLVYRVGELLQRTNRCDECGKVFSRRDALVRHRVEQRHQLSDEPRKSANELALGADATPVSHTTYADDPLLGLGIPPVLHVSGGHEYYCGLDPSTSFPSAPASLLSPSPPISNLPSLEDWETLICAWVAGQQGGLDHFQ